MTFDNLLACFKTYDVRGKLGEQLNEEIAYRIGRATAQSLSAKTVALGFDSRETSISLAEAVAKGICDSGSDVLKIGLAGTEEMYAAVTELGAGAGIEVTASHNPIDYNGMKIVKNGSQPLTVLEFANIKYLAEKNKFILSRTVGSVIDKEVESRESYIKRVIDFVDLKKLKPLKIVINSGNGTAGTVIDALNFKLREKGLKPNFVYLGHDPDPSFPNGIPNPLLEENRSSTSDAVIKEKADFGVAFDGDFDRCFLFDHHGDFIPGEYVVGLLAEVFLRKEHGATIVHDPRVVWNTLDVINKYGGHAVQSKTGHAFVKAGMRGVRAVYGGEMSAHHYFRDFSYCDSGMIPWLLIWELLSKHNIPLADLVAERKSTFPSSGEVNFTVANAKNCINQVKSFYSKNFPIFDELDGLSMSFKTWRFNLRNSNTEPLVRLNVETKGDRPLLREKIKELTNIILNA